MEGVSDGGIDLAGLNLPWDWKGKKGNRRERRNVDLATASERRCRGGSGRRWRIEDVFAADLVKIGLGPGGHGGRKRDGGDRLLGWRGEQKSEKGGLRTD